MQFHKLLYGQYLRPFVLFYLFFKDVPGFSSSAELLLRSKIRRADQLSRRAQPGSWKRMAAQKTKVTKLKSARGTTK